MDVHRRMLQRRQAFNGFPFDSTGGLITDTTTTETTLQTSTPTPTPTPVIPPPVTPSPLSSPATDPSPSSSSSSSPSLPPSPSPVTSPTTSPTINTPTTSPHHTPTLPNSFTQPKTSTPTPSPPPPTGTSGNDDSSANVSTGAVVGGIAAGILGLAGIIFAILYFIRRMKKRKSDDAFDSDVFKRQSRMLNDEPQMVPDNSNDSPFAPRPPTMIERRMNSTPVSGMGSSAYGPGSPYGGYNDYNAGYNSHPFTQGQAVSHHQSYGDSYMGSLTSIPTSPPMSVNYGDVGAEQSQSAYLSRQLPTTGPAPADNSGEYVDMSRSSVTPFQAAQYEEIHRRLNMPPPAPVLGSLAEEEYPREEPAPKGPSPFADSSEDVLPPPSPVHSNRGRIDSSPPMLPELNPPMSPVYVLRPGLNEVPSKQTEASTADIPAALIPARPNPAALSQKRPDTVYTIYDDEDAYAGI